MQSAITGGKYEEFRFIHPSMRLVFWFPHHLSHRIRPGQVYIIIVVDFVVVVIIVVVVVVVVVK